MFKKTTPLTLFTSAMLLIACSSGSTESGVDFSSLASDPSDCDGKVIKTTGWHVDAFETSALGEAAGQRGGATYLTEPSIWINRAAVRAEAECFIAETIPHARFCRMEVEGRFEYGETYGHLGAYKYQITHAAEQR